MTENYGLHTAAYRRGLADEARAKADLLHDEGAKNTLLGIASSYDRLAFRAAGREKSADNNSK